MRIYLCIWMIIVTMHIKIILNIITKSNTCVAVCLIPNNKSTLKNNMSVTCRKIPPFVWVSCCWTSDSRAADHQGRNLRYTHTTTDSSTVTDTFTSTSARRLNTLHSSTLNPTSTRHVQLRLPPSTNNINTNNTETTA